jgi:hypothetical protein
MGNALVRPPRLELEGAELDEALKVIREALEKRPNKIPRKGAKAQS